MKRDQWMLKESKSILERTKRALEPEVQRLIDENKEALHLAEIDKNVCLVLFLFAMQETIKRQKELAVSSILAEMKQMRESLLHEKDDALQRERELNQMRFRDQTDQHETQIMQLRSRFLAEAEQERLNHTADLVCISMCIHLKEETRTGR